MFSLPAHSLPLCATTVYGTNTTEHTRPTATSIRKRARRENLLTADSDPPALATQAMHGCRLRLRCEVPGLVPMCTRKAASLSAVGRQVDVRSARSGQSEVLETQTTLCWRVKVGISAKERESVSSDCKEGCKSTINVSNVRRVVRFAADPRNQRVSMKLATAESRSRGKRR
ncbi:hypothetical protein HMN09_00021200 [Mycena chlorophos]|uniref:Uncharacterized protein n=1 Tax=Mycena chlorophos TaxID=658473 RepID=A0A8H6TSC1_MYCCL|nr:hypothetical protein HMN09_00021200 [Mycena chlorophos]